ncbi:chemotaxis protein MotB [Rhodovulum sp. BSW8]|uniref:Chemotaxis protein MotB n=1 Tax=Rhodovulum visakhapatnamense TaxID=364297 RepID=A0A4R8FY78_9RHOB|nr:MULTISPECIES: flagellar motor protein MotB [Rhodovulum]OLS43264.1 chemotaxis protein MotB [Rhodovulum sulfidophilum]MBL3568320.1 flagellar motor protein MotB [Rhodovulum visakhapatnamense]MBL3578845.1 flagellar motor protein MotB [Rhodovulum visakhapatnamense]RBO53213.1 chemotaxis protein MotB [Rhodovulum sp. BSW8]TDX31995.1 chemotaxis protein MotB [Rhodovulum visakhapatnamense]
MAVGTNAPVIIKRKKVVGGGGHHGGAWKVAYADFVTAMMAFFLLMWLLNATTEKQRKGIADYFNPTIPVNRVSGGGEGAFGGESIFSEETLIQRGTGATQPSPSPDRQAKGEIGSGPVEQKDDKGTNSADAEAETQALKKLEDMINGKSGETILSEQMMRHIVTRLTDEGLIIELFDIEGVPLFDANDRPTEILEQLTEVIGGAFGVVRNKVSVAGHVSARPVVLLNNPVWDISTLRAQTVRKMLEDQGVAPARIERVTGFADRKPAVSRPMAVRNNRIELTLLRSDLRN